MSGLKPGPISTATTKTKNKNNGSDVWWRSNPGPRTWGTQIRGSYLMRWKVRFQRVSSKKWRRMWPMKPMRWPMLCLSIWSAGVWKDQ